MDELNRKLAEWAGLHRNEPTGGFWWDSEGNLIFDFHKPEEKGFTHSLDLCFKWLVPKVLEEYNIEFYSFKQKSSQFYSEVNIWKKGKTKYSFEILQDKHIAKAFEQGKDLDKITALALCKAVEELI